MSFSTCTRRRGVEIWWIGQGVVWVCLSMHLYIKQRQLTVSSCCVYACTVSLAWTRRRIEIWGRRCCTCAVMRQTRCWDLSSSLLYAYCFSCTRRRGDEISVRRSYNVLFQLCWDLRSQLLYVYCFSCTKQTRCWDQKEAVVSLATFGSNMAATAPSFVTLWRKTCPTTMPTGE